MSRRENQSHALGRDSRQIACQHEDGGLESAQRADDATERPGAGGLILDVQLRAGADCLGAVPDERDAVPEDTSERAERSIDEQSGLEIGIIQWGAELVASESHATAARKNDRLDARQPLFIHACAPCAGG